MAVARVAAHKRIKAAKIPCDWISTVHDDIKVDTQEKYVQPIVDIFHSVFDDLPKNLKAFFGYEWVVPMECECKIGMTLKDMKKIKRSSFA